MKIRDEKLRSQALKRKQASRSVTADLCDQLQELTKDYTQEKSDKQLRGLRKNGIILTLKATVSYIRKTLESRDRQHSAPLPSKAGLGLCASRPCNAELMEALMQSTSLGVMYMCIDNWVVRQSNKAMELVCDFLKGYRGSPLSVLVHPHDLSKLAAFKDEIQKWDRLRRHRLELKVRVLRMNLADEVLLSSYTELNLEVASVARDGQHDNKVHVLFTCVLEPNSLRPLTRDDLDATNFEAIAAEVSGSFLRSNSFSSSSFLDLNEMIAQCGSNESARFSYNVWAEFLAGIFSKVGRLMGLSKLGDFVSFAKTAMTQNLILLHNIVGMDVDKVPWVQTSAALSAFGYHSKFLPFVQIPCTAEGATFKSIALGGKTVKAVFAACLSRANPSEILGFNGLIFMEQDEGVWELLVCSRFSWVKTPSGIATYDNFVLRSPNLPRMISQKTTYVGSPDQELMERFSRFDEIVFEMPFGLAGRNSKPRSSSMQNSSLQNWQAAAADSH